MQIGFVNFSQEELARKNKVLQMVRDQTAIDELGFGRIRDAFANWMFPGMSTLQRRAKYFAVMPSLFFQATKKNYNTVRDVRSQIVKWEIRLTDMLVKGAGNDEVRENAGTDRRGKRTTLPLECREGHFRSLVSLKGHRGSVPLSKSRDGSLIRFQRIVTDQRTVP